MELASLKGVMSIYDDGLLFQFNVELIKFCKHMAMFIVGVLSADFIAAFDCLRMISSSNCVCTR